jgi:hypothetical protein
VEPNLKYAGEAVFFLGAAFRLLRWAMSAVSEGDAPPSAFVSVPSAPGAHPPLGGSPERVASALATPIGAESDPTAWYRVGNPDPPPAPGDPALFPPEMLAAMTPEQRAKVLEALTKQHANQLGRPGR